MSLSMTFYLLLSSGSTQKEWKPYETRQTINKNSEDQDQLASLEAS